MYLFFLFFFSFFFFFFNDTATTEIYTLSLHDALPIRSAGDERDHGSTSTQGLACGVTDSVTTVPLRATTPLGSRPYRSWHWRRSAHGRSQLRIGPACSRPSMATVLEPPARSPCERGGRRHQLAVAAGHPASRQLQHVLQADAHVAASLQGPNQHRPGGASLPVLELRSATARLVQHALHRGDVGQRGRRLCLHRLQQHAEAAIRQDRKSTRLNSSHV